MRIRYIVCLLLTAYITIAQAKDNQKVVIKEATVFLNGAELLSTAKINLPAGETEIVFINVAGDINQKSLNVGADNNVLVKSAVFRNDYLADNKPSERAQEIKDSIDYLNTKQETINNQLRVIDEQLAVLRDNRQLSGSSQGVSVAELQKMMELVKNSMSALLTEKNTLNNDSRKLNERRQLLQMQLNEEMQKVKQPGGQLVVKFYTKKPADCKVTFSYVTPNAGWVPSYDLRVDKIQEPVQLTYKAHVFQHTGVDWDKVTLRLSTGNPNESAQAPVLNPWYLAYYRPRPVSYKKSNTSLDEVVVTEYKVPLVDKYSGGTTRTSEEIEKMPTRNTSNMVSSAAGAYNDGTLYIIDGVQVYGSRGINDVSSNSNSNAYVEQYTDVDNQGVNTLFDIDLPYTIPTDGRQVNVEIKTATLPASYRYYAVPKLDHDAFLQAQITGWEDLNLLPAQTNVFYEGTYVGEGYIDVRNLKDTMSLSLGRDKKIVVLRERDKELRSVKTLGSNVKEAFVYKISIRNTRSKAIDMVILDQVPISNNKDIDVMDKVYDEAEYNDKTGLVMWTQHIEANKTKELSIGYTVKYPKGRSVNL